MRKKIDLTKKVAVTETIKRRTTTHITAHPINYRITGYYTTEETEEEIDEELDESTEETEDDEMQDDSESTDDTTDDTDDSLDDSLDEINKKRKQQKNQNGDGSSNPSDGSSNMNNGNSPTGNQPAGGNTPNGGNAAAGGGAPTGSAAAGGAAGGGAAAGGAAGGGAAGGGAAAGGAAGGGAAAGGAAAGGAAAGGAAAGGAAAGGAAAGGAAAAVPVIVAILIIILVLILVLLIIGIISKYNSSTIAFGGMYNGRCSEMTVIFVDPSNGYKVTGSETYSMTDYVAGVVYAEVGGAHNKEVYKTFAIAARTFGLKHASDDCAIEGSARRQAFKDITDRPNEYADMIYEAVEETEGQVLISNGELYSIQYDAFCYINKDSNYYTLSQKNQKIPTDWVESNIGSFAYKNCPCDLKEESMTECWSDGIWQDGGHGKGMSQYGSYYLARELGYTYDEILNYYYSEDGTTISSSSFMTSIAGLEIKDTTKAIDLKEPIEEFLSSKGSSLEDMNNFIHDSVVENGAGTREGVVTAAVSLINYLYDNFNTKLPYYWGGKVYSGAIPASFGTYSPSSVSRGGNVYYYKSFDCSGFVSWTIRNGGYNFSEQSTTGFDSTYSKNSCNITESSCIGQPGDLINSRSGHVELIIAVDQENNKYFVAHSGGSGVVMQERSMHTGNSSNVTKIIFMEEFYSNSLNVNPNY